MAGRILVVSAAIAVAVSAGAQIPDVFENLQFFPETIAKDELVDAMRHFSFALGVRCQHYFPDSVAIAMRLGPLYENVGDTAAAIASYERVLAVNPENEQSQARLEALKN